MLIPIADNTMIFEIFGQQQQITWLSFERHLWVVAGYGSLETDVVVYMVRC